jgi:hypothetical protein
MTPSSKCLKSSNALSGCSHHDDDSAVALSVVSSIGNHLQARLPRSAAKLLARDEARRIAANIAKLDLLGRGSAASPDHLPGLFGGASASVTRSNRRKQGGTVPAASRAEFARWQRAANNRRRVAIRQMCGGPSTRRSGKPRRGVVAARRDDMMMRPASGSKSRDSLSQRVVS